MSGSVRESESAAAAVPETVIEVQDVVVRYGEVTALTGVDLRVGEGRIVGLVGMNGSGKSSLFGALMGLVGVDSGSIRLFDGEPARARKAGRVSYVPQSEKIDADFPVTVRDVVRMGRYGRLGILRRLRPADHRAVEEAIARVGLGELADRSIGALSGGQRKRAFVARAIAQDARLLLLDEPFAGVDVTSQATITALLHSLRDEGRTILISTHDLAGVPALCDDVLLLHRSAIAYGPPAEVLTVDNLARAFGAVTA